MAKSRPRDEQLASFCWLYDTRSVKRIFKIAQGKLSKLGQDKPEAEPFPQTETELGSFDEASWRDWIKSIQSGDTDHIDALRRLVTTCRIRLGHSIAENSEEIAESSSQGSVALEGTGKMTIGGRGNLSVAPDVGDEAKESVTASESISFRDEVHVTRKTSIGSGCRPRRHATANEKCLNIDEQTEAISTFIRSASSPLKNNPKRKRGG